jgi:hypothetical protein
MLWIEVSWAVWSLRLLETTTKTYDAIGFTELTVWNSAV